MDDLHLSSEESSRLRGLPLHHMTQTGQVLLQAWPDADELGGATDPVVDLHLESDESFQLRHEALRGVYEN